MFEKHAGLFHKRMQVVYGHKVCLSFGQSGVVLQAEILRAIRLTPRWPCRR